jgi:hypothetical protein
LDKYLLVKNEMIPEEVSMVSKMIDFGYGVMPKGFSKSLTSCFDLVTIDMYATPDLQDKHLVMFFSESDYFLVTARGKKFVNYRELGSYELLDVIYSEGNYLHSFFIAENIFTNLQGIKVKLIALLYEERGNIHIWNPSFEELFLPLIKDDIKNKRDSHLRNLQEIYQNLINELDVCDIAYRNQVDYEIEECRLGLNTSIYYALLKHIFIVENEKYPQIPGAYRTLKSYIDLYNDYLNNCVNILEWRQTYNLKDPWV